MHCTATLTHTTVRLDHHGAGPALRRMLLTIAQHDLLSCHGLEAWRYAYFLMSASLVCGKSLEAPGFSLWSSAHSEMSKESSIAPERMHAIVSEYD